MQHNQSETPVKKRSAKIYFFFIAISVLVATNLYYVIEYKNLGKMVEVLSSEKNQLQAEIDRIEAELDRITQNNPTMSQALMDNQVEARAQIANLRFRLASGNVSGKEIEIVRFEVQNLRYLVDEYHTNIEKLKKENLRLSSERDKLQVSAQSANEQVNKLKEENTVLQGKVETASGLKISEININAIQLRSRERERIETKAKKVDLLRIDFDLVENTLAPKGLYDVFLRIIDPSGNLLTVDEGIFEANGKKLQYTFKSSINFSNDGKMYSVDWQPIESIRFQPGVYTVVLYANGITIGRANIALK